MVIYMCSINLGTRYGAFTIKKFIANETRCFLDNHKKYVLWIIDIAKLLAVVCGATLLGILFVKAGFPETNIVVIYIFYRSNKFQHFDNMSFERNCRNGFRKA